MRGLPVLTLWLQWIEIKVIYTTVQNVQNNISIYLQFLEIIHFDAIHPNQTFPLPLILPLLELS